MIFAINDDQIDEYGRIEVAIRELHYSDKPRSYIPLYDWKEMMDLIIDDGFYPDFIAYEKLPSWFEWIIFNRPSIGKLVKERIVKKWSKKLFDKYGEPQRSAVIHKRFKEWCDSLSEENCTDFSY